MTCKACNSVTNASKNEDCFEKALDVLKKHYTFYKNSLLQRDLELRQIKERNEKLNKALQLLQQQQPAAKRFKSQSIDDYWSGNNSSQEERVKSDLSLTDDEPMCVSNLNIALNSEQLFDTSALSQAKNEVILLTSSSELVQSPHTKESHKRNKQRDIMRCLKDRNKTLGRSKSEWHTKDRKSPAEKSWAMKFLQAGDSKNTADKRLCLSLKKPNPSKIKQSLLNFNKTNEESFRETEDCEDVIEASPVIPQKNPKGGRSWAHRSGHNHSSNNSINVSANATNKKTDNDDSNKTLDDIVFDFSPSKKTDSDSTTLDLNSPKTTQPKQLKFDNDASTDCTSLPKELLGFSTNKTDTSSVVLLTPGSQDIIFVDDTCDYDQEIDTMDLLDDNLEKLKKYESKCIQKQQNKKLDVFKKPKDKLSTNKDIKVIHNIKQEKITQDLKEEIKLKPNEEKPSCSSTASNSLKTTKSQKNLGSFGEHDTEDEEDFMPKPFIVKQEPKLSIKQRFNIDCEDCEKLINFLDKGLTDAQIQQHLDKCKRHNNGDIMHQNTPKDFWNPFILSFQADDPRNEVLIDNRFKDIKK